MVTESRTLFDKIWDLHLIAQPAQQDPVVPQLEHPKEN